MPPKPSKAPPATAPELTAAGVTVRPFGRTAAGEKVALYTLRHENGAMVSLMTYGATVVHLLVPDRDGHLADVSLGFDTLPPYFTQTSYFGATIGRCGNRLARGRFVLEGKSFRLARNNGLNHLHGGEAGFDKQVWEAEILRQAPPTVRFHRLSPAGEEGYPGNLQVAVTFTLTARPELKIRYEATTDAPTVLNLTNHTYFNLAGAGSGSILEHRLRLRASHYTPVNARLLPTGEIRSVEGTPLDFRRATPIGSRLAEVGGDPVGYDHNMVLDRKTPGKVELAAEVYEPGSGRVLQVLTDQPGLQFYTGNFLDGTSRGKGRRRYRQHEGFCLETQHFPDSPNQPAFPSVELRPGETFRSTTLYRFGIR